MNLKKLIYCVHAQPALWDQRDEGYNNKVLLKQIWEDIAYDMGSSAELCRQKWRSLRDVFRRELKKYQSRLQDPKVTDKTLPRWYYFKELHFLTNQMLANAAPEPAAESPEEVLESFINNEPEIKEEFVLENSTDNDFATYDNSKDPIDIEDNTDSKVRFINESVRELFKRSLNSRASYQEERKRTKYRDSPREDDSDYHFLMSLLPFMQAIPQSRKLAVRSKMQDIFREEAATQQNDNSS